MFFPQKKKSAQKPIIATTPWVNSWSCLSQQNPGCQTWISCNVGGHFRIVLLNFKTTHTIHQTGRFTVTWMVDVCGKCIGKYTMTWMVWVKNTYRVIQRFQSDLFIPKRWRSSTTFPKGHVFTIPKRSPAELPGRWWQFFSPRTLGKWSYLTSIFFQMGWFNHQQSRPLMECG